MKHNKIKPYNSTNLSKKEEIRDMFNAISHKYDLINSILTFGIDQKWRKKLTNHIDGSNRIKVLDVATGTGDLAIKIAKQFPKSKIIGIDIAEKMIHIGESKIEQLKLKNRIELYLGDCESLKFNDNAFDYCVVSFGIRNFENLTRGLSEIYRVLKSNGRLLILESSQPKNKLIRWIYKFYFHFISPKIGRAISKDTRAYTYLPESVSAFPQRKEIEKILFNIGFVNVKSNSFTFGVATIYHATK